MKLGVDSEIKWVTCRGIVLIGAVELSALSSVFPVELVDVFLHKNLVSVLKVKHVITVYYFIIIITVDNNESNLVELYVAFKRVTGIAILGEQRKPILSIHISTCSQ